MGTIMVTLTLQILCRAYQTAHRRRSLRPDLLWRTLYQRSSSVLTSQTRWSHQSMAHPRRQGSEWSGWPQPHTLTKNWGTHWASRCSEVLNQDWPGWGVPQHFNRRRLGATLHFPHTHGLLLQSHYATSRLQCSCHDGTSHVRNL